MKYFLGTILASLLLFVGVCLYFYIQYSSRPDVDTSPIKNNYYSKEEFVEIEKEFREIVLEENPRVALLEAESRAKADDRFANSCHSLVHHIGHTSYEKYQDFGVAMQYSEPVCNVGYVHGISQALFKNNKDITSDLLSVCDNYSIETSIGWECIHGIGHGLMLATNNDVNQSLEYCDTYDSADKRWACYTGLFMENYNTNMMFHPSDFLDESNPFELCSALDSTYQDSCYHYAVHNYIRTHENDFQLGLARCGQLEGVASNYCARGVGDLAIKDNINTPLEIERLCMAAKTTNMQLSCIGGMTSLYTNQYGNIDDGYALCDILQPVNVGACMSVVSGFPNNYYDFY